MTLKNKSLHQSFCDNLNKLRFEFMVHDWESQQDDENFIFPINQDYKIGMDKSDFENLKLTDSIKLSSLTIETLEKIYRGDFKNVILIIESSCLAYLPNDYILSTSSLEKRTILSDDAIRSYLENSENLGSLTNHGGDIKLYGRKIKENDIKNLKFGTLSFKMFHNVTKWFVTFLESYLKDEEWKNYSKQVGLEESLYIGDSGFGPESFIDDGHENWFVITPYSCETSYKKNRMELIGYSLENINYIHEESSNDLIRKNNIPFAVTTLNEMSDPEDWKGTFHFKH